MEIIYATKEFDKREIYKHIRSASVSITDVEDGTKIAPVEVCIYADTNNEGEDVTITSIIDGDGNHYASNSRFFREELKYLLDLMGDEFFEIIIRKPVSKNGRTFVTCELA